MSEPNGYIKFIVPFLELNGFEKVGDLEGNINPEYPVMQNKVCKIIPDKYGGIEIITVLPETVYYCRSYNLYRLVGLLTINGLIDKNFKQE